MFNALLIALFLGFLLRLSQIDIQTGQLPDRLTLPLLWLGLLANLEGRFTPLSEAVMGAVAGYLSLWSLYWAFKYATGREGMGHGDFKLLAALGAWLGWMALPWIVLLASVSASLWGIVRREKWMAFGPWLALAGASLFLFQQLN